MFFESIKLVVGFLWWRCVCVAVSVGTSGGLKILGLTFSPAFLRPATFLRPVGSAFRFTLPIVFKVTVIQIPI